MTNTLKLRAIYALHMVLPMAFARWHIERLDELTVCELWMMFGGN